MRLTCILLVFAVALLAAAGCRSTKNPTSAQDNAQPQASPADAANDGSNAEPEEAKPEAEESGSADESDNSNAANSKPAKPIDRRPRPALSSKGATRVELRNVDFHVEDSIVLRIRDLHGSLLRTSKGTPPTFDDKRSFIIGINSRRAGLRSKTTI
jgi:hypothetical protein